MCYWLTTIPLLKIACDHTCRGNYHNNGEKLKKMSKNPNNYKDNKKIAQIAEERLVCTLEFSNAATIAGAFYKLPMGSQVSSKGE